MTDQGARVTTVDLTPGPELSADDLARLNAISTFIAGAFYDLNNGPKIERVAECILAHLDLPGMRDAAYRAGREDAARDIRVLTVGHDEGNILHDAMDLAADVADGKCAGGIIRLVPKGERA